MSRLDQGSRPFRTHTGPTASAPTRLAPPIGHGFKSSRAATRQAWCRLYFHPQEWRIQRLHWAQIQNHSFSSVYECDPTSERGCIRIFTHVVLGLHFRHGSFVIQHASLDLYPFGRHHSVGNSRRVRVMKEKVVPDGIPSPPLPYMTAVFSSSRKVTLLDLSRSAQLFAYSSSALAPLQAPCAS